jgi:hypothetical protein
VGYSIFLERSASRAPINNSTLVNYPEQGKLLIQQVLLYDKWTIIAKRCIHQANSLQPLEIGRNSLHFNNNYP